MHFIEDIKTFLGTYNSDKFTQNISKTEFIFSNFLDLNQYCYEKLNICRNFQSLSFPEVIDCSTIYRCFGYHLVNNQTRLLCCFLLYS